MNDTIILISLPRSGTSSFCEMLNILGYQTYHAPHMSFRELLKPGWGLADTPMYAHSIISEIESQSLNVKFIYIDRNFESWYKSMTVSQPLFQSYSRFYSLPIEDLKPRVQIDLKYYTEVFGKLNHGSPDFKNRMQLRFNEHRDMCLSYAPFVYSFGDGWEPLCEFLSLDLPNVPVPHKHKETAHDYSN